MLAVVRKRRKGMILVIGGADLGKQQDQKCDAVESKVGRCRIDL